MKASLRQGYRRVIVIAEYLPFKPDSNLVPPMANAGSGYRFHVTGLTHDERGYPAMTVEAQDELVRRLVEKIERNRDEIIELEEDGIDDAEVVVCSYFERGYAYGLEKLGSIRRRQKLV